MMKNMNTEIPSPAVAEALGAKPRRAPRLMSRAEARADLVARRAAQAAADVAAAAKAVADDDTKKSRVIASSHADCSHPATKAARAACRRSRAAETIVGDQLAD